MEIVHFAPFAPNAAGIYEAARDMVRADTMRGHMVSFVDTGALGRNNVQSPPVQAALDDRAGFQLMTLPPEWADTADLLVYHTGVPDGWVVKCQAPILLVVHGRPLACFRAEQNNPVRNGYSTTAMLAKWPRVKKLLYFWPEHTAFWRYIAPDSKLACLDWPPIDTLRFSPDGPVREIPQEARGRLNALICDSWREDIDCFEIMNGAIAAAERIPGLKVHLYAIEPQDNSNKVPIVWDYLIRELRKRGALGELWDRQINMERVYRSMDFVLTPHRIVTRVIGEALACGVPVVAAKGCKVTPYTADPFVPEDVARAVLNLVYDLSIDRATVKADCLKMAEPFGLERYGEQVERVYQEAVG